MPPISVSSIFKWSKIGIFDICTDFQISYSNFNLTIYFCWFSGKKGYQDKITGLDEMYNRSPLHIFSLNKMSYPCFLDAFITGGHSLRCFICDRSTGESPALSDSWTSLYSPARTKEPQHLRSELSKNSLSQSTLNDAI